MADILYAVATYNPIAAKSTDDLRAIQRHNNREEPLPHVVPGAPPPHHLIGTGDLVHDVETELGRVGLNIRDRRANGVLAYELVLTASHDFFATGTAVERHARLMAWLEKQIDFLIAKFGRRVVSMVLHRDEYTPHVHCVLIPIVQRAPVGAEPNWALVGRSLSGPGCWQTLQTDYAEAMAEFGLARGELGSERKHRPYSDVVFETENAKAAAKEAEEAAQVARETAEKEKAEYLALARATEAERGRVLQLEALCLEKEKSLSLREKRLRQEESRAREDRSKLEQEQAAAATERRRLSSLKESVGPRVAELDARESNLAKREAVVRSDADSLNGVFNELDALLDLSLELHAAIGETRRSTLPVPVAEMLGKSSLLARELFEVKVVPASPSAAIAHHRLKQAKAKFR